jgi:hypothetical protein
MNARAPRELAVPRRTHLLLVGFSGLLFDVLGSSALASERKETARKADCVITVGDRDARGLDLVIGDCAWPVAPEKVIAVVKAADKHDDYLDSVAVSDPLPDGRILQVHKATGIGDRQVTLRFTDKPLADGGFRSEWTRAEKQEPLGEDRVDPPVDDGWWEVHADGKGGSRVQYGLRYDAGGKVPTWVVRAFQSGGIADILAEMREAAEKRK